MMLTEYNEEETMNMFRAEGRAEGLAEGLAKGRAEERAKVQGELAALKAQLESLGAVPVV